MKKKSEGRVMENEKNEKWRLEKVKTGRGWNEGKVEWNGVRWGWYRVRWGWEEKKWKLVGFLDQRNCEAEKRGYENEEIEDVG